MTTKGSVADGGTQGKLTMLSVSYLGEGIKILGAKFKLWSRFKSSVSNLGAPCFAVTYQIYSTSGHRGALIFLVSA